MVLIPKLVNHPNVNSLILPFVRFYEGVRTPSAADIQMLDNAVFDTEAYKCTHGAQLTSTNSRDVLKLECDIIEY